MSAIEIAMNAKGFLIKRSRIYSKMRARERICNSPENYQNLENLCLFNSCNAKKDRAIIALPQTLHLKIPLVYPLPIFLKELFFAFMQINRSNNLRITPD